MIATILPGSVTPVAQNRTWASAVLTAALEGGGQMAEPEAYRTFVR